MDFKTKIELITKNLHEVIGSDELEKIVKERPLKIYWGTAPTNNPHIGYLVPLVKIAFLLKAECDVTILFADLHAFLDSMKSEWSDLDERVLHYEKVIKGVFEKLQVPIEKLKFVRGTSFQLKQDYTLDVYKLMTRMTLRDSQKAGTEVVKQSKNPKVSSLIYPGLQALDEKYLGTDAQFGGIDQRKIFTLSKKYLASEKEKIYLLNPLVPSFSKDGKMSSSDVNSKIDLFEDPKIIRKKISKAFCLEGSIDNNPILIFVKFVIFPILELRSFETWTIERDQKYGGDLEFSSYKELEKSFSEKIVHPFDIKNQVANFLIDFFK